MIIYHAPGTAPEIGACIGVIRGPEGIEEAKKKAEKTAKEVKDNGSKKE